MNKLYFGDCLDILKKLYNDHPSGFIDLIYIDPPFNSKRNYNILFESADLKDTKAQKEAFADTWSNISYKDTLEELKGIDLDLFSFLESLDKIRISKSAVSYLTTMAIRIYYMHKVLKNTGSFYLHCDPTMSHYLKIICDLIFSHDNFRNEIIWKRTPFSGSSKARAKQLPREHDIILFYSKSQTTTWNTPSEPYSEEYLKRFKWKDERGFYRKTLLKTYSEETLRILKEENRLIDPIKNGAMYSYKQYLNESSGQRQIGDIWIDINMINPVAKERLGYPTQKPEALLERTIQISSNEGDLVSDFFCGCGTTIAVAQRLKRKWLGVDISHLAIGLIERRLIKDYGEKIKKTYEIEGLPQDIASAKELAKGTTHGRFKFQDWVIETLLGGIHNPKKTADGGWDGHLTFEGFNKKEIALIEVKSGTTTLSQLKSFITTVNKRKGSLGVFVCFKDEITKGMLIEAKEQGYFNKDSIATICDKIQIISVEDLMDGKTFQLPQTQRTTLKSDKINGQESFL